jgi:hypothetical protein
MARIQDTIPSEFTPRFLEHLDGRTVTARILRERLDNLQNDLGGEAHLSYQQRSLCRRAIWLETVIETSEAQAATGEAVDIGKQVQALNSLIGLYRALGLERKARDVPDLQAYLARKATA